MGKNLCVVKGKPPAATSSTKLRQDDLGTGIHETT